MTEYNGYTNWESFEFSAWWTNDQELTNDFVEKTAGGYLEHKWDRAEIGRMLVEYARDHYYTGKRDTPFWDLETDAEWDAIDREECGEEAVEAVKVHGRYAHLLEDETPEEPGPDGCVWVG